MAPIEGGDPPIRRLDTQVVGMIEEALGKINGENYVVMADLIGKLLAAAKEEGGDRKWQGLMSGDG